MQYCLIVVLESHMAKRVGSTLAQLMLCCLMTSEPTLTYYQGSFEAFTCQQFFSMHDLQLICYITATTWTNADLSSVRCSLVFTYSISKAVLEILIHKSSLIITLLKLQPHLQGVNELIISDSYIRRRLRPPTVYILARSLLGDKQLSQPILALHNRPKEVGSYAAPCNKIRQWFVDSLGHVIKELSWERNMYHGFQNSIFQMLGCHFRD